MISSSDLLHLIVIALKEFLFLFHLNKLEQKVFRLYFNIWVIGKALKSQKQATYLQNWFLIFIQYRSLNLAIKRRKRSRRVDEKLKPLGHQSIPSLTFGRRKILQINSSECGTVLTGLVLIHTTDNRPLHPSLLG